MADIIERNKKYVYKLLRGKIGFTYWHTRTFEYKGYKLFVAPFTKQRYKTKKDIETYGIEI